jgi:hypothetical protein
MNYVVCAFYTPDYSRWVPPLEASLDRVNAPYDIALVDKVAGGWEANTRQKPAQVLAAMDRHPNKSIIFLDVDCIVRGSLAALADIRGDIGVHMPIKRRPKGARLRIRTGTLVVRPTPEARRFVEAWVAQSARARIGDNDQTTFAVAVNDAPGVVIEPLARKWCSVLGDDPDILSGAAIVHDSASLTIPRMGRAMQLLRRLLVSAPSPSTTRAPSYR